MSETVAPSKSTSSGERKPKSSKRRSDQTDQRNEIRPVISDEPKRMETGEDSARLNRPERRLGSASGGKRIDSISNDVPSRSASPSTLNGSRSIQREKERVVRDTVSTVKSVQLPSSSSAFSVPSDPSKLKSTRTEQEDNYDDDFEDYNDDFEDEEPSKPIPKSKSPQVDTSILQSLQNENATALERKLQSTKSTTKQDSKTSTRKVPESIRSPPKETSSIRRPKKFVMSMGDEASLALDPRYRRLSRLMGGGILDLQEEKSCPLNLLPTTPFDFYSKQLRIQSPPLRQVGVPNQDDRRDCEASTEDIVCCDKQLQFSFGDDTTLLNIMDAIKQSRKASPKKTRSGSSQTSEALSFGAILSQLENQSSSSSSSSTSSSSSSQTTQTQTPSEEKELDSIVTGAHSSKFSSFLQKASTLMEGLLNERPGVEEKQTKNTSNSIFDTGKKWASFGTEKGNGSCEFIRPRHTSLLRHSTLLPNLLLTAHPPPRSSAEESEDLRPSKALYCIWDATSPASPSFLLESSGVPSCLSFSASQPFIVAAGTEEGCLYLWDLRESSATHTDRDSIGMKIDRGIRKPSYSTHSASNTITSHSLDTSEPSLPSTHSAPILQLEALASGSSSTSVSQFASMDSLGTLIIWMSSEGVQAAASNSSGFDFGASPWSSVMLTQTRVINTSPSPEFLSVLSQDSLKSKIDRPGPQVLLPFSPTLSIIPGDSSTFLVSGEKGRVIKVSRFGSASHPVTFDRALNSEMRISDRDSKARDSDVLPTLIESCSSVTCMATTTFHYSSDSLSVSPQDSLSKEKEVTLFLVGRENGSIDLYRTDYDFPLQTWDISEGSRSRNRSVHSLHWISTRHSAFLASDCKGNLFVFDMLKDFHAPILTDRTPEGPALRHSLDLSTARPGSKASFLTCISNNREGEAGCTVKTRRIRDDLLLPTESEGQRLNDLLETWASKCFELNERVRIG